MKKYKLVLPPEVVAMAEKWPDMSLVMNGLPYSLSSLLNWGEVIIERESVVKMFLENLPNEWLVEVPEEPKPLVMRVGGRYECAEGKEWEVVHYNSAIANGWLCVCKNETCLADCYGNLTGEYSHLVKEIV